MSKRQKEIAAAYAKKAGLKVIGAPKKVSGYGTYYPKPAYKKRAVRGYGGYGQDIGSRLGGFVGNAAEDLLGGFGKALGFGDYAKAGFAVKKNSLLNGGNDPPVVRNAKDGRFILRHREYIQDIITGAAGAFSVQNLPINPGIQRTFPWLAEVAQAFEQYRLRGMLFEFKSTSGDALNSTNTALGSIIMATEYDSSRPLFTSKQQMENHQFASSARQSCSMLHPIECDRSQTPITDLYIRTGLPSDSSDNDTDLRMSDWGNFQIATTGQQAASVNIGELWVTYEIELLKPCINEVGPVQLSSFYFSNDGTFTAGNYFGTPGTSIKSNTGNAIQMDLSVGNIIRFPKGTYGTYLLAMEWVGTANALSVLPTFAGSAITEGVTLGTAISPFTTIFAPANGETCTKLVAVLLVSCFGQTNTGAGPGIVVSGGVLPNTPTTAKLYVTSVMDGLINANNPPLPEEIDVNEITDDDFKEFIQSNLQDLRFKFLQEKDEKDKAKALEETSKPSNAVEEKKKLDNMSQEELLELYLKMKAKREGKNPA